MRAQKTPDETYPDELINPDPFWPDLSMSEFIKQRRLPPEYDSGQTRRALIQSLAQSNIDLTGWKELQQSYGYESSDDIGNKVDGESLTNSLYISGVYSRAKAQALIHFATLDSRENAENLAKSGHDTYQSLMTEWNDCMSSIRGETRASVKLL